MGSGACSAPAVGSRTTASAGRHRSAPVSRPREFRELHEIRSVVSTIQRTGLEIRHVEGLSEHYALTLRAWVRNVEAGWADAATEAGLARARIWRLYVAASAINFEAGRTQVHQTLAVRADGGRSGLPLRPGF